MYKYSSYARVEHILETIKHFLYEQSNDYFNEVDDCIILATTRVGAIVLLAQIFRASLYLTEKEIGVMYAFCRHSSESDVRSGF